MSAFLIPLCVLPCPTHLILIHLIMMMIFGDMNYEAPYNIIFSILLLPLSYTQISSWALCS